MKRFKILLQLLVLFIATQTIFAQRSQFSEVFVGGGAGGFLSTHSHFSDVYKSGFGEDYFGQLGLSAYKKTYLSVKLTYFHKTGVPIFKDVAPSSITNPVSGNGNADFKEWIINAGIIYNLPLFDGLDASLNGGFFYAFINENQTAADGSSLIHLVTKSLGLYLGGGIEYHIPGIPFSIFGETQYNLASQLNGVGSVTGYGGLNINAGVRIYIDTGL